ncbi:MAG TPA: D-alanyl-D-alanine carboxypeptidase/D-alanyl-D-alanine-endopeptidase [Verrucomicrobiae bacterium]|nr:D-alanyl-D-alanine carboxypeptidase/D-alanyl-D-alanine-endopeptidase [Verrucomicrobiae bacterium]
MRIGRVSLKCAATIWALVFCGLFLNPPAALAQKKTNRHSGSATKGATATSRFARRVDALVGVEPNSKGAWGLLIADAETGQTLYEQNAAKYFVPASNMKLFTTALALDKLGPEFRFRTTLESTGVVSPEGELSADLVLVGRGDPNLSNRKFPFNLKEEFDGPPERVLAELADALVTKGVKKMSGDVIGDDSYFPRERYPNGWEIDDMVWEYGAAISALVVNDNTATVTLTPGQVAGDAVQVVVAPPRTQDFVVNNQVTTSAANVKADLTLTREPGAHLVVVRGTLPERSAPRKLVLAIEEPALHAATLLKALLEQRGVEVSGGVRARHEAITVEGITPTVLADHVSVPLGDSVKLVNKISQNLHTEVLLRTAMRQAGAWNSFDDVTKFAADFYAQMGIAPQDMIQTDGSGLSRHDMVTPRAMLTLLRYAQTRPWFESFFASLPVAGVDGTLEERMKNTPAAGRVHAKTGSVEHVRSMSGFADTAGGRRLAFSFMTNNEYGKNHETTDAMNGLCLAMIEEFNTVPAQRSREHKQPQ